MFTKRLSTQGLLLCLLAFLLAWTYFSLSHNTRSLTPLPTRNLQPLTKEHTPSLEHTIALYKLKHDRNPPPRFNKWYKYATEQKCFLDDYDAIYRDLAPFMEMSPEEFNNRLDQLRNGPHMYDVSVLNGRSEHQMLKEVHSIFSTTRSLLSCQTCPSSSMGSMNHAC